MCVHVRSSILHVLMCASSCPHLHVHAFMSGSPRPCIPCPRVHVRVSVSISVSPCSYVLSSIHIHTHLHTHIHTHVHVHIHTHKTSSIDTEKKIKLCYDTQKTKLICQFYFSPFLQSQYPSVYAHVHFHAPVYVHFHAPVPGPGPGTLGCPYLCAHARVRSPNSPPFLFFVRTYHVTQILKKGGVCERQHTNIH